MTNRIILSGILWITALVAAAQVSYLDRITVETKAVRKVDDNVTVDLLWQFAGLKVNTQNQAKFMHISLSHLKKQMDLRLRLQFQVLSEDIHVVYCLTDGNLIPKSVLP